MEFLSLSPGTIVTPVISITPPRIIELNEVSGSVETNSSSKRARARVPHPTRQLRRRSKSNLPIGVNYRLTMPGLARCLNVRARTKSDGVISYTNGITRSNSRADKRPTKKAAKVEADPSFPVSFYYLLPCWFDLHPPPLCPVIRAISPDLPRQNFDSRILAMSASLVDWHCSQRLLKLIPPDRF